MESLSEMGKQLIGKVTPAWLSPGDDNGNGLAVTASGLLHMMNTTISDLEDRTLLKILAYVNYSDLLQLRLANQHFFNAISHSPLFLASTVFVASVKPGNQTNSSFLETPVAYQNTRFQNIDYDVYLKQSKFDQFASGNYYFRPSKKFLGNLESLEFHNCFITWETIKRIVNDTPNLQQLALDRCVFTDQYRGTNAVLGEFDEFRVGTMFSTLKVIKINEHEDLKALNKLLEKLVGYSANSLEKINIAFNPKDDPEEHMENPEETDKLEILNFCNLIGRLIELSMPALKSLALDLKYRPLLNLICPQVFGMMDNLWEELQLEEFSLSPPGCTPLPNPVDINQNGLAAAQVLIAFLESQVNLTKVALPHIKNMGSGQEKHYRTKIGQSFPRSIEYLCIPNQEYLVTDFHTRLPNLKKLYIGGSTSDNGLPLSFKSEMFDDNKTVTAQPKSYNNLSLGLALSGSQLQNSPAANISLDRIIELGVGSSIINGIELMKTIKKFHNLVKLDVASQLPVFQDEDLQCCIENMPWLQYLGINACDFLTDFGLTGIMRNSCEMMVRLSDYHQVDDSILNAKGNTGKALSKLKGLRHLVLMGKSHITDVGIHFGLRFQELQSVCLPYNENITEWGMRQFGLHNPSVDVFVVWSLNKRSKEGFLELQEKHPRIRKTKCISLNSSVEEGNPNDYSESLVKFDIVQNAFAKSMSGMCPQFSFAWLIGQNSREFDDEMQAAMMPCESRAETGCEESTENDSEPQ